MKINQKEKEQEKEIITYEQIIAGALLKFESIDEIDFSLLSEDFQEKTNMEIRGLWYSLDNIDKYIKIEKRDIILKESVSLDCFIEEENRTLKEKLLDIAGDRVNNYFKNLDIQLYYKKKTMQLQENKDKVLNFSNVLLISENQEDYDELVKYGFQNIDYFRSLIRADKYFAKYPERLNKYHIILQGPSSIHDCCFEKYVELENTIRKVSRINHLLDISLCKNKSHFPDRTEYFAYLSDERNWRSFEIHESSYTAFFDRIVENTLINRTLDRAQILEKIPEYSDYVNPNRLPLPNVKSSLKILYLDSVSVNKYANDIAKNMGLNVTFKDDNNYCLGKHVKSHLGDYDIIIASDTYSSNLLSMNIESTEQCKDTGRNLTLLVSYEDNLVSQYDEDDRVDYMGIGSKINLRYKFAGNLAPENNDYNNKEFRVLRKLLEFVHEDEAHKKDYESDVTCIEGILGSAVNIYNDALLEINKSKINDLDLKSAEEFDNEYEIVEKQEEERKKAALAPIKAFDGVRDEVSAYLDYKKRGLITQMPKGLKITEGKEGIKVENIYQGRTLCTITFSKEYRTKNLRVFKMQTLSKKGILSNPQTIGLYTRIYENLEGIPSRPDEKQANALLAIKKKISVALSPLNNKAWSKYLEIKKQNKLILERKKKTNNITCNGSKG